MFEINNNLSTYIKKNNNNKCYAFKFIAIIFLTSCKYYRKPYMMIIKNVSYFIFFAERSLIKSNSKRQNVKWSLSFKTIQVINIIVIALLRVKVSLIRDAF